MFSTWGIHWEIRFGDLGAPAAKQRHHFHIPKGPSASYNGSLFIRVSLTCITFILSQGTWSQWDTRCLFNIGVATFCLSIKCDTHWQLLIKYYINFMLFFFKKLHICLNLPSLFHAITHTHVHTHSLTTHFCNLVSFYRFSTYHGQ